MQTNLGLHKLTANLPKLTREKMILHFLFQVKYVIWIDLSYNKLALFSTDRKSVV